VIVLAAVRNSMARLLRFHYPLILAPRVKLAKAILREGINSPPYGRAHSITPTETHGASRTKPEGLVVSHYGFAGF